MYTGEADWTLIGEVKANPRIHIPIIGNGDVTTPEIARSRFEQYGVDGVMVGRATFGCPWIFEEMRRGINGEANTGSGLTIDDKIDVLEEMLRINVERIDEYRGILTHAAIRRLRPSSREYPTSDRRVSPCCGPRQWPI